MTVDSKCQNRWQAALPGKSELLFGFEGPLYERSSNCWTAGPPVPGEFSGPSSKSGCYAGDTECDKLLGSLEFGQTICGGDRATFTRNQEPSPGMQV